MTCVARARSSCPGLFRQSHRRSHRITIRMTIGEKHLARNRMPIGAPPMVLWNTVVTESVLRVASRHTFRRRHPLPHSTAQQSSCRISPLQCWLLSHHLWASHHPPRKSKTNFHENRPTFVETFMVLPPLNELHDNSIVTLKPIKM